MSAKSQDEYFFFDKNSYALVNYFTNEIRVIHKGYFFKLYKFKREVIIQDIADIKLDLKESKL